MRHVDPERQEFSETGRVIRIEPADHLFSPTLRIAWVSAPVGSTTSTRRQHSEGSLSRLCVLVIAEKVLGADAEG